MKKLLFIVLLSLLVLCCNNTEKKNKDHKNYSKQLNYLSVNQIGSIPFTMIDKSFDTIYKVLTSMNTKENLLPSKFLKNGDTTESYIKINDSIIRHRLYGISTITETKLTYNKYNLPSEILTNSPYEDNSKKTYLYSSPKKDNIEIITKESLGGKNIKQITLFIRNDLLIKTLNNKNGEIILYSYNENNRLTNISKTYEKKESLSPEKKSTNSKFHYSITDELDSINYKRIFYKNSPNNNAYSYCTRKFKDDIPYEEVIKNDAFVATYKFIIK